MQDTVDRLSQEYESETLAELERHASSTDDVDVQLAFQDIRDMREYVIPRFVRGPFAVSLAACLESGIKTVAELLRERHGVEAAFRQQAREAFLASAQRYFQDELNLPLDLNMARSARLVELQQVRNAMAHHNGVQERLSKSDWENLLKILSRRGGAVASERRGALVLTHPFVAGAYADVNACLRSLMARAQAEVNDVAPTRLS